MKLYRSSAHFPYRRYAADAPRYRALMAERAQVQHENGVAQ